MRYKLTNCIVNYIFDNLGITLSKRVSLKDPIFQLKESIEYDNGMHAPLYGSEVKIDNSVFRMLLADFSDEDGEFILVFKLEGCPSYGCYLYVDSATGEADNGLICFSAKENAWLRANINIQATFLAGMENLRGVNASWEKLSKTKDMIDSLKSFFEYQNDLNELQGNS